MPMPRCRSNSMPSSGSTKPRPLRRSDRSTPELACPTPIRSACRPMLRDIGYVLGKFDWTRAERIWPNGLRYLWADAFGVVLYVALYRELGEEPWLEEVECLVAEVERVLGRPRGLRIGEAPDRDGQYFHYLALWLFALARLGDLKPEYRARGLALARAIHPAFVIPGRGALWKMKEDLSGPYPGYGLGAMDA